MPNVTSSGCREGEYMEDQTVSGNERKSDRPNKSVASDRPNIPGPARRPFGWLEEGTRAEIDTFRRRTAYEP
jgi:hypothetical protein